MPAATAEESAGIEPQQARGEPGRARSPQAVPPRPQVDKPAAPGPTTAPLHPSTELALDLHRELAGDEGNSVVATASVATVLAMLHAGAAGEAAAELSQVLGVADEDVAGTYGRLGGSSGHSVSHVWHHPRVRLRRAFKRTLAQQYGAGASGLDFAADPRAAEAVIDAWAATQTEGVIQDFLTGALAKDTRVVVANAVHFDAQWKRRFERAEPGRFDVSPTDRIDVPLMVVRAPLRYRTSRRRRRGQPPSEQWEAVELPYADVSASMLVLVPALGDLARFEQSLTPAKLQELRATMRTGEVVVHLPRLRLASPTLRLQPALARLGVEQAFSPSSGLQKLAVGAPLLVDDVFTQTKVVVDERGTVAAAATAGPANPRGMPARVRATRPFLFLIIDDESDAILFVGRVARPAA